LTGADPGLLADPASGFFALIDEGELTGFRSFGADGQVPGGEYDDSALDTGGGLQPDLTGKGLGRAAIQAGLDFGRRQFAPAAFRVTIASFNVRAQRVVQALGFRPGEQLPCDGGRALAPDPHPARAARPGSGIVVVGGVNPQAAARAPAAVTADRVGHGMQPGEVRLAEPADRDAQDPLLLLVLPDARARLPGEAEKPVRLFAVPGHRLTSRRDQGRRAAWALSSQPAGSTWRPGLATSGLARWYVSGEYYLGTLVVRHQLTPRLAQAGGNVGYHVIVPWQRQGHAARMLAAGLTECRRLGLDRVLLTCDPGNEPSRKVILANGGVPDGREKGEDRFWITLDGTGL